MPVWPFWCILTESQPLGIGQRMGLPFSPHCELGSDPSHLQRKPQEHSWVRGYVLETRCQNHPEWATYIHFRNRLISLEMWEAPRLQGRARREAGGARRETMLCLSLSKLRRGSCFPLPHLQWLDSRIQPPSPWPPFPTPPKFPRLGSSMEPQHCCNAANSSSPTPASGLGPLQVFQIQTLIWGLLGLQAAIGLETAGQTGQSERWAIMGRVTGAMSVLPLTWVWDFLATTKVSRPATPEKKFQPPGGFSGGGQS